MQTTYCCWLEEPLGFSSPVADDGFTPAGGLLGELHCEGFGAPDEAAPACWPPLGEEADGAPGLPAPARVLAGGGGVIPFMAAGGGGEASLCCEPAFSLLFSFSALALGAPPAGEVPPAWSPGLDAAAGGTGWEAGVSTACANTGARTRAERRVSAVILLFITISMEGLCDPPTLG